MIKKLIIRNYALIESLDIDFSQGFSVITGETGAGKSIILGALSLILGQRVDTKVVTDASVKTLVEGSFDIAQYELQDFFDQNDIEYDATDCIIRREISPTGKSRAFINDSPVTVALLKQLGDRLIDIHSQHQNLLLADGAFQLRLVDVLAHNREQLAAYQAAYHEYRKLERELSEARRRVSEANAEEDYLRFQHAQLFDAQLVAGEQEELEQEQEILAHAGDIKEILYEANACMQGEEHGILSALNAVVSRVRPLQNIYPEAASVIERMQSAYIELKDIDATLSDWNDNLSVNPDRLARIEERLSTLYMLKQKHHVTSVEELIALRDDYALKLNGIENGEAEISALEERVQAALSHCKSCAEVLTRTRTHQAPLLAARLTEELRPLGMPHVQIAIDIEPCDLYGMGAEQVVIRFSANKNHPLLPVADIASGGEISRLMLCVKSLMADVLALPTIIFDEIDTGVSGDIAARMGGIMKNMSQYMQVIAITHLPQVAAIGNNHYRVYKDNSGDTTHTQLLRLDESERVDEIARMLSGTTLTDAALNNARALLTSQE